MHYAPLFVSYQFPAISLITLKDRCQVLILYWIVATLTFQISKNFCCMVTEWYGVSPFTEILDYNKNKPILMTKPLMLMGILSHCSPTIDTCI